MNKWTKKSIELANGMKYLDLLYDVYPIKQNKEREVQEDLLKRIKKSYNERNKYNLVKNLLEVEIFPIKDSYISFFRRDMSSIEKNPKTVQRVADILLSIPYDKIVERCKTPKESNRQIGPMFKKWVNKVDLGLPVYKDLEKFSHVNSNGILNVSDEQMLLFAKENLQYNRKKGIDFIARKNGKYIIGEAKFLTDFGGHQNAQLDDALKLMESFANISKNMKIIPIVIADGVIYINNDGKMYELLKNSDDKIILSSLLLKEFIKSI